MIIPVVAFDLDRKEVVRLKIVCTAFIVKSLCRNAHRKRELRSRNFSTAQSNSLVTWSDLHYVYKTISKSIISKSAAQKAQLINSQLTRIILKLAIKRNLNTGFDQPEFEICDSKKSKNLCGLSPVARK